MNECKCKYEVNNLLQLGPIYQKTCCAMQGFTNSGDPKYGYCKNVSLPYVNYNKDFQRSPYDNDPWRYRKYTFQTDIPYKQAVQMALLKDKK